MCLLTKSESRSFTNEATTTDTLPHSSPLSVPSTHLLFAIVEEIGMRQVHSLLKRRTKSTEKTNSGIIIYYVETTQQNKSLFPALS